MTSTEEVARISDERREYKFGFVTDIEQDFAPPGLDESTVRFISAKKDESRRDRPGDSGDLRQAGHPA